MYLLDKFSDSDAFSFFSVTKTTELISEGKNVGSFDKQKHIQEELLGHYLQPIHYSLLNNKKLFTYKNC